MKKIASLTIVVVLLLGMFTFNVSAQENVSVYIDGTKIEFDVQPQIINGRTLVPFRTIFETLGYEVIWDNENQMAIGRNIDKDIVVGFKIGYPAIISAKYTDIENQNHTPIDVPAQIINGRTLIPLRALSENIGAHVEWEEATKSVLITTFDGYSQGQYKIGYDMPAGEYILISNESSGYFAMTTDANGNNIIQNDNFGSVTYINAEKDTYLKLSRCYAIPYSNNLKFDVVDNGYVNGIYKCGKDLPAGTYKLSVANRGYYAIYNKPYGKIESNDNFYEDKYITIKEGQYVNLKNVKVALYRNDSSSNEVNANKNEKYDNGAPTYTAITGIELIEKVMILGTPHYRYQYTVNADVGKYMEALEKNGWTLEDINVSTYTKDMEAIYEKNDEFIEIKVDERYNNVWIKFYSSDF